LAQLQAVFGSWTSPVLINAIAGGTTRTQRIGGSVTLTSFLLRGVYTSVGATTAPPVRILVVYDKQPNGALPSITDILAANDTNSPLNISNSDRFHVISDEFLQMVHSQDGTNGVAGYPTKIYRNFFKSEREPGYQMKYLNNNNATIADITTGSCYLMMSSFGPGSTATSTLFTFYSRFRFTDM